MTFREFLKELPLFNELTDPEIDQIAPLCSLVEGKAGDCLIREGEPVPTLYFLLSGQAAVIKSADEEQQPEIGVIVRGAVIGELSLMDNAHASATIVAKRPFKALAIDREAFNQVMDNNHSLGYKIFRKLARNTSLRLRLVSGKLAESMTGSQDSREEE
jgi:CRP-like cAMP-binding protein